MTMMDANVSDFEVPAGLLGELPYSPAWKDNGRAGALDHIE